MRTLRSKIWTIPTDVLVTIVQESSNFAEVLRKITPYIGGEARNSLKRRLVADGISTTHFNRTITKNINRKIENCDMFVCNSPHTRSVIKRRIIRDKLLPYRCSKCECQAIWNNEPLTMVLDHINGIPNDHRIENLRFLCPNCNSQTPTFAGRNTKRVRSEKTTYTKKIPKIRKVDWAQTNLLEMKKTMSNVKIAQRLGVSETMVRKKLKSSIPT